MSTAEREHYFPAAVDPTTAYCLRKGVLLTNYGIKYEPVLLLVAGASVSRRMTDLGDSLKPHFTLLALQGDKRPSFADIDRREIMTENPVLAVGLSGLYGQFKAALAVAGTGIQVTPAAESVAMFKNILAGTPEKRR